MSTLAGKVALVTGGTSGIGRATAELMAAKGAKVVVTGRREAEGQETIRLIEETGGEGVFIQGDMSKEEDIKMVISSIISKYGKLDIAFNNAGVADASEIHDVNKEMYDKIFGVNVWGVLACMKHEIPVMLKTGGGSIINMSSVAGHIGAPSLSVYIASKHAVEGLTKVAAMENAQRGIRVNAVAPAVIDTAMADQLFGKEGEESRSSIAASHPMGRCGFDHEVAEAVLWLASDASSYTTGHSLPVDGGYLVP